MGWWIHLLLQLLLALIVQEAWNAWAGLRPAEGHTKVHLFDRSVSPACFWKYNHCICSAPEMHRPYHFLFFSHHRNEGVPHRLKETFLPRLDSELPMAAISQLNARGQQNQRIFSSGWLFLSSKEKTLVEPHGFAQTLERLRRLQRLKGFKS